MKKIMLLLICFASVAAMAVGAESDMKKALGVSPSDWIRWKVAVGITQHLLDGSKEIRAATDEEAVAEILSQMNALVLRTETHTAQVEWERGHPAIEPIKMSK